MKKIMSLVLAISLLTLTGCANNKNDNTNANINTNSNNSNVTYENIENSEELEAQVLTATELTQNIAGEKFEEVEVDENSSTKINLNGNSIEVDGSNASVEGTKVTILSAGTYVISGTLNDGQIVVNAGDNNVTLVLDNANITCKTSSPIYVEQAKNTVLYLNENTVNYVADTANYVFANGEDEPDSTIFSKDDFYITGTGTLNVTSNYNDAIKGKDDLSILSGTINITSVDDGIIGKDSLSIKDGNITIVAGGDGLKSTNDTDTTKGYIAIQNGTFNITATSDGIQATTDVSIQNGTFNIVAGGGSVNASTSNSNNNWGRWETTSYDTTDTQSAKGIKAENNLTIFNGTFTIDSSDDAIHSNSNVIIENGTLNISTGDDGIHADTTLNINNGSINISKSYEGIEAATIALNGGNINITSSDDGINVAGGNDASSLNGRPGQNSFTSMSNNILHINGGTIVVNATGDGLDANGSIYMTGGNVTVYGPTDSANGIFDYDREFSITGGTLIGMGSAGMMQANFTSDSQLALTYRGTYGANETIEIKDGNGNIVASVKSKKNSQIVLISTPDLKESEEYSIYINGTQSTSTSATTGITNGNMGMSGGMTGGGMNGGRGERGGNMMTGGVPEIPSGDMGQMQGGGMMERPSGDMMRR